MARGTSQDNSRLIIALTIVVAIVIIIMAPDMSLLVGGVAALIAFLTAMRSKQGQDRRPRRRRSPTGGGQPSTCAAPPPPCDDPPINQGPPAYRAWANHSDPGAVYEYQAINLADGGRAYRDGFAAGAKRCEGLRPPTSFDACSATGGCSAAEQERLRGFGDPDPDWQRLAAKAEAQGVSLAQGGGGPGGPGAYVRGAPFTTPGYRPDGVTVSQEGFSAGGGRAQPREGFSPLPGGHAPHAVFAPYSDGGPYNEPGPNPAPYGQASVLDATPFGSRYPGAIQAASRDVDSQGAWALGARDRQESEDVVIDGNPFDPSRLAAPGGASACEDDEANDMEQDADESNINQVRSRNDPTRVTAGTMNRRRFLDPFLREELEQEENKRWWGRHEV